MQNSDVKVNIVRVMRKLQGFFITVNSLIIHFSLLINLPESSVGITNLWVNFNCLLQHFLRDFNLLISAPDVELCKLDLQLYISWVTLISLLEILKTLFSHHISDLNHTKSLETLKVSLVDLKHPLINLDSLIELPCSFEDSTSFKVCLNSFLYFLLLDEHASSLHEFFNGLIILLELLRGMTFGF